jgi:hypothetical protein
MARAIARICNAAMGVKASFHRQVICGTAHWSTERPVEALMTMQARRSIDQIQPERMILFAAAAAAAAAASPVRLRPQPVAVESWLHGVLHPDAVESWKLVGIHDWHLARRRRSPQPPCKNFRCDLTSRDRICTRGQFRQSRSAAFKPLFALRWPCGLFCWTDLPSTCHTAVVRRGPVGMTCV